MSKNNISKNNLIIYLSSFVIPIVFFAVAFLNLDIYPGGPNTVLIYDMRAQLLALYGYLSNPGYGVDGLFYNMSGGLGGGFFGTVALYVSPLDLVYCLIPLKSIPDAVYIMLLFRIGLSGLFFSIFARRYKNGALPPTFVVLISCCYALMSYNFMYSMSPMWLDIVMYLPLLAMMSEKIADTRFSVGFCVLLAFCIISDYYIAYMAVIALSMYYVYILIEKGNSPRMFTKKLLRFAFHGIISAGLASIVIFPIIFDFARGKIAEVHNNSEYVLIKNSLFEVLSSFKSSSYSTLNGGAPPNIFCGTIIVILALIWLVIGKKNIKARITAFTIILIYLLSFILGPFDRAWHGFRDPVGFSARYSFTFSFFMICYAVRGFELLENKLKESAKGIYSLLGTICILFTAFEMYVNGAYILARLAVEARYANRKEYDRYCDAMNEILNQIEMNNPDDYYRICKNFRYSRFDGALFGYDGLERFSSSYNYMLNDFLAHLGLGASYHTLSEFGITPPVASFVDMEYFISYYKDCSDDYDFIFEDQGFSLYKNQYRLPLAFEINNYDPGKIQDFTEIPFENINILFSDLTTNDLEESQIFVIQDSERRDRPCERAFKSDSLDSVDYMITPEITGKYWLYSEYVETDDSRYKEAWERGHFSEVAAYADYYLNNQLLGTYRNDEFTYCDEVGSLNCGEVYAVTLETSMSDVGDTYFYYFDEEKYKELYSDIVEKGYNIINIDSNGIVLNGISTSDSCVLITLPFERGYNIYVDGKKSEYTSYRNALLLIPVTEGTHEIVLKYIHPGLLLGICSEFLAIIIFCIMIFYNKKRKMNVNNAQ